MDYCNIIVHPPAQHVCSTHTDHQRARQKSQGPGPVSPPLTAGYAHAVPVTRSLQRSGAPDTLPTLHTGAFDSNACITPYMHTSKAEQYTILPMLRRTALSTTTQPCFISHTHMTSERPLLCFAYSDRHRPAPSALAPTHSQMPACPQHRCWGLWTSEDG